MGITPAAISQRYNKLKDEIIIPYFRKQFDLDMEMAEVKTVATRVGYGEALVELGKVRDDFLVFDADLAAATQTGKFKAAFPDRFYDCGIAEQNMMGIAAGIAATGKRVIVSSFAMFASGRAKLK